MTDSLDRGGRTDPRAPKSEPRPSGHREAEDREWELSRARDAERELRSYSAKLGSLAEAALAIQSSRTLNELVRIVTERSRELIGAHRAVTRLSSGRDPSRAAESVSVSDEAARSADVGAPSEERGIAELVSARRRPVRMTRDELAEHPRLRGFGDDEEGRRPFRGLLAAPLIGREGHDLGFVEVVDKSRGDFTAEDEALLMQLAQLASVAIENVRLYERARDAVAARDSVMAVVSHDLRDPLSAVVTSTALLEESCPPDGASRRAVRTIRRSIDQMSRLIEDLQDAARLEEGRLSVEPAEVPVDQILDEVHQMFLPRAEERSLHLIRESSEEAKAANVFADRARLVQVLSNLLGNSVRMTPEGGTIRFGAEPAPEAVSGRPALRFFVGDSGPGISSEHLPHLFRPFWRAEGGSGGAGLGLAIARGIVEAHGGEIRAQNRGDSGALFSFDIPRP